MITKTLPDRAATIKSERRLVGIVVSAPNPGDPYVVDGKFYATDTVDGKTVGRTKEDSITRNAAQIAAVPAVKNALDVLIQYLDAQQDGVEAAANPK